MSVGSTDAQSGSKPGPSAGIKIKPQSVAIADISKCRVHLAQTKTLSKWHGDAKRIKGYYKHWDLWNNCRFNTCIPKTFENYQYLKPVAIQYIFSTLSNLKKILNNVEISNATNYNSKLMNCSQKKNKLQTSVSVFCSNRPRESSNALWYLWDKNVSFSEVVRELSVSENLINPIMKYFKWILPLHYYLLSKYYYHFFYITCTCTLFCK